MRVVPLEWRVRGGDFLNDWFEWNGVRCTEYGIHVLEQPSVTVSAERTTFTNVPGRSEKLTILEGDGVCDGYHIGRFVELLQEKLYPVLCKCQNPV